jgi:hypothetical protein
MKNDRKKENQERKENREIQTDLKSKPTIQLKKTFIPEQEPRDHKDKNPTCRESGASAVERKVAGKQSAEGELYDDWD